MIFLFASHQKSVCIASHCLTESFICLWLHFRFSKLGNAHRCASVGGITAMQSLHVKPSWNSRYRHQAQNWRTPPFANHSTLTNFLFANKNKFDRKVREFFWGKTVRTFSCSWGEVGEYPSAQPITTFITMEYACVIHLVKLSGGF